MVVIPDFGFMGSGSFMSPALPVRTEFFRKIADACYPYPSTIIIVEENHPPDFEKLGDMRIEVQPLHKQDRQRPLSSYL